MEASAVRDERQPVGAQTLGWVASVLVCHHLFAMELQASSLTSVPQLPNHKMVMILVLTS